MHNWPKLGIKCLNSINILNENWSSQSLILGQFSASMAEPHFRININIYNDVNINVNVKITIAHQVGIILQPLGSDHSSLNNTIEFRTSHSNQLVFIALFFAKREHTMENWNCEIAPTQQEYQMFVQGRTVDQVKWTIFLLHSQTRSIEIYIFFQNILTIFLLQFQINLLKYIFFLEICEPSFYCNFKLGLLIYIFSNYVNHFFVISNQVWWKIYFFLLQNMWRLREQLLQISAINSFMVDTEPDARPVKLWKLLSSKYSSA